MADRRTKIGIRWTCRYGTRTRWGKGKGRGPNFLPVCPLIPPPPFFFAEKINKRGYETVFGAEET